MQLPSQSGEASWASLKNGGGPHREDVEAGPQILKRIPVEELGGRAMKAAMPYDCTESGYRHVTKAVRMTQLFGRIELPA